MSIRRCVGFFEVPMRKGESSMCCEGQEVSGSITCKNMVVALRSHLHQDRWLSKNYYKFLHIGYYF